MSQATLHPSRLHSPHMVKVIVVAVLLLLGGVALYLSRTSTQTISEPLAVDSVVEPEATIGLVQLTQEKLVAGGLETETVTTHLLQPEHTVPGRLLYNETRHISIKTPITGILSELPVKPGDKVSQGDLIAVVNSADIGRARSEILRCQSVVDLAVTEHDRMKLISQNLEELLEALKQQMSLDQIEKAYSSKSLGDYRKELLTAYSRYLLATELLENVKPIAQSGAIAGRQMREWESEVQITRSAFRTSCDQSRYDAQQAERSAAYKLADAERMLTIAQQELKTLMGNSTDQFVEFSGDTLSSLEIRAPFDGSIESLVLAKNERLSTTDPICVLADTTSLYVSADIREKDWQAVELEPGTEIKVTSPALPGETLTAKIHYIGREVSVASNAVPLIATIDNSSGQLRPGMFVRVQIPVGAARESIAVPLESVMKHDNEAFVFIDKGENAFERIDIKTGTETQDWVEVLSGLQAGQKVVRDGAFLLKSELLLEGEEE
ncbi:MAG: efflux RND transporter periplasmic adaptor subunit [Planctomycetaceae bacterium]|nr:efflux RND transporter periplasmic adaptor subunit [Planctomycetaceae bacterium]